MIYTVADQIADATPMTTDKPTVIPFSNGARHIQRGDHTVCGFRVAHDGVKFAARPMQRISCRFCFTERQYAVAR